eukprot:446883_1
MANSKLTLDHLNKLIKPCSKYYSERETKDAIEGLKNWYEEEAFDDDDLTNDWIPNDYENCHGIHIFVNKFPLDTCKKIATETNKKILFNWFCYWLSIYINKPTKEPISTIITTSEIEEKQSPITEKTNAVCNVLCEYYKCWNMQYNQLLSMYCDENEFDLTEEIQLGYNQCGIVDFDPHFPIDEKLTLSECEKQQLIFDIIKHCYYNSNKHILDAKIPQCLLSKATYKYLFILTLEEWEYIKKEYKTQCPILWKQGLSNDNSFLYVLAIGRKYNFAFLQNLVDDCFRVTVENVNKKPTTENEWYLNHKFIKSINNIVVRIPTNNGIMYTVKAGALIKGALASFSKRICAKYDFTNLITINDSLEIVVNYLNAIIEFIGDLVYEKSIFPFQLDCSIAFSEPKLTKKLKHYHYFDCIGNIKTKLDKNKLLYASKKQYSLIPSVEIFNTLFEKLKKQMGSNYPLQKRVNIFIDRRPQKVRKRTQEQQLQQLLDIDVAKNSKKETEIIDDIKIDKADDEIWIFDPPSNCNCKTIPNNTVSEWYLSSSKTCLLPNIEFRQTHAKKNPLVYSAPNQASAKQNPSKLIKANIGSTSHCKASLLTFSFHVKEIDGIKCYLFWNGAMIRFMADDIKIILPTIFNMQWNNGKPIKNHQRSENEKFMENENEINQLIYQMKNILKDKDFDSFQNLINNCCSE